MDFVKNGFPNICNLWYFHVNYQCFAIRIFALDVSFYPPAVPSNITMLSFPWHEESPTRCLPLIWNQVSEIWAPSPWLDDRLRGTVSFCMSLTSPNCHSALSSMGNFSSEVECWRWDRGLWGPVSERRDSEEGDSSPMVRGSGCHHRNIVWRVRAPRGRITVNGRVLKRKQDYIKGWKIIH